MHVEPADVAIGAIGTGGFGPGAAGEDIDPPGKDGGTDLLGRSGDLLLQLMELFFVDEEAGTAAGIDRAVLPPLER